ncbi:citrate synthase family protein [Deinococcus cellulosilyticus]|uniref:citrate synthase (unknown stereospecificity) n=1 Tax=Deinococcus cellulosilyticus (strain DSM 18568 / NBRC 106333 / KACC 11606 / 5516J-15) TaxID=1223518 RepID=A0A511N0P4_DEIC1|nr:citrate synthase family protein [Deinococcus cellulosilyticus]GEM46450.1 hypothetical protein DC3_20850 [Deinococcus cellulosilyticus NBRC 106333 = KACC 11606]
MSSTLTAEEAAQLLGISRATLYSYVSRGMIRSVDQSSKTREKRYLREDIDQLISQKEQRKNPGEVAKTALHWGSPVLDTSISLIEQGRLFYRGQEATALARSRTFEEVASFLWTGDFHAFPEASMPELPDALLFQMQPLPLMGRYQCVLAHAQSMDLSALNLKPSSLLRTGRKILSVLTWATTGSRAKTAIAEQLSLHWTGNTQATTLIDQGLILCAEHELNISAFTVRCAVSAEVDLYAAIITGLSSLQGRKHGGMVPRVDRLLQDSLQDGVKTALQNLFTRGERTPGFSQPLYPQGDPRGKFLLNELRNLPLDPALRRVMDDLIPFMAEEFDEHPTIDWALAVLARHLGHPVQAGLALFALGRTAGWIAHALEQYQDPRLIRPRASYVGPQPQLD